MADIVLKLEGAGPTIQVTLVKDVGDDINIAKNAYLAVHPIPQKVDPEWIDPEDGTPPDMVDIYGPAEHFLNNQATAFFEIVTQSLRKLAKNEANVTIEALKANGSFEVLTGE